MQGVSYRADDGIGWLTLDRPEALNAMDPPMMAGIREGVARAAADPQVRVLVVRGGKRAFSAGSDLKYLDEVLEDHARYFEFVRELNDLFFSIEEAPIVTVAMVRGLALAGGLELMLACDLAIASEDARIGDQHANFGLMPGGGSTQRLVRRVGLQRGKELLFTGSWVTGTRAAEIGLVLEAVPDECLESSTVALAQQLATKSKRGLGYTKRAVHRGYDLPMRQAIDQESHALFEYFTSSSSPRIGIDAFRNRRTPEFNE